MIIYKVTNKINGKAYIGQTVNGLEQRKQDHISRALNKENTFYFHHAIRKYGPENFSWEIIHNTIDNIDELNEFETHYIDHYNTFGKGGYNSTSGGMNYTRSEDTKKKLSRANKGKKLSEDHKKKISETLKGKYSGKKSCWYGRHHSKETKKKLSKIKKGRYVGKDSPYAKATIIGGKYFDTMNEAAEFVGVTHSAFRYRLLHKTKWLDYKYA
jgi:group I intron endonuclease